jgi:dTDP-glucose 4,6-dehydratase
MNIIGERQDKEKFLPITISNLTKQQNVPVHAKLDSSGKWEVGSRYYLHARNQADALRFLLEKSPELDLRYTGGTKPLEKFNVVGEQELRNDQLVELVAQFLGVSTQIEWVDFHSSRPGHDLRYALDGRKLKALGWKPPVPLEKSIERTVQWYMKNSNWLT